MKQTAYKLIIGTVVAGMLLLYFFFDARQYPFPRCPFYVVTNFYCPGCGSQRALSSLLHGEIAQALHNNCLLVFFIPFLLYSAFVQLRSGGNKPVLLFYNPLFVRIVLIFVISFWMLRNLPFYPFSILVPIE